MNLLEYVHQQEQYKDLKTMAFCHQMAQILNVQPVSVFRFWKKNELPAVRAIELTRKLDLPCDVLLDSYKDTRHE